MLRLMHLVHGRSCSQRTMRVNVCPANGPMVPDGYGIGKGTYEITRHVLGGRTWLATRTTRLVHLVAVSGWVNACVPLQDALRGGSHNRDTR